MILVKGSPKLSSLEIDVDKDWQGKDITNIRGLAAAMAKGDLIVRGDSVLQRMVPGLNGLVLTSAGPGNLPTWAPPAGQLQYYFPVAIGLGHATLIETLAKAIERSTGFSSVNKLTYADAPADGIKLLGPDLAVPVSTDVTAVAHSQSLARSMGSDLYILVDGAVSETNVGAQTDETSQARDGTGADLNLPPMVPGLGDKYYLGSAKTFRGVWMNISTGGAGNWTVIWYYWDGLSWAVLPDEQDETASLTQAGMRRVNWTVPGDWALTTIQGKELYWAKAEVAFFNNQTTKPKGSQAWVIIK